MNLSHVAVHELVNGMSGKGKSTLIREKVAAHPARWKFVFDTPHKQEFHRLLKWPLCYDKPTLERATFAGRPSAFVPHILYPGDRPSAFDLWIEWVYQVGQTLPGGKLVIIEEIEKTTPHQNSPLAPAFAELLDEGRAMMFDVLMVAQRVSTVNFQIRSTLTDIFTFQQTDPDQLDWLEREQFSRASVSALKRGEYIHRDRETGETLRLKTRRR